MSEMIGGVARMVKRIPAPANHSKKRFTRVLADQNPCASVCFAYIVLPLRYELIEAAFSHCF